MKRLLCLVIVLALAACREPAAEQGRPVLFIGLDGADWQSLDPLMKSGVMPQLAALAREGRSGVLETIQPPLSPLIWTTMMTGASPLEHGVLDFTRFNPVTGAEEPITREERRVPAVWDLAGLEGRSVAVFGMWATWPAEPVKGLMVADRFFSFTSGAHRPPPGIVHPPEREAWARETLARVEDETGYEALKSYIPWLERSEYDRAASRPAPYAHPVSALRRILVETRAYDALARSWLERETPDLTVLYFQGTDTIGHMFAPFSPPRRSEVTPEDFERYQRVPELYFAEVDRLLGEYRKLAEAREAVLMLASDHGFLWGDRRPAQLSSARAATAGLWHDEEGMYLIWGLGSGEPGRGKVDQVCATLLALLGLPPGQGLAGPPLSGESQGEPVDYRSRWRPAPIPRIESSGEEEVAKLRALGYLGAASGKPRGGTRTAGSYNNEGLLLKESGRTQEAAQAFQKALEVDPDNASALWNLSELLAARGDLDRADDLLIHALEKGLPNGVERVFARVRAHEDRKLRLLERAIAALPREPRLHLALGDAHQRDNRCEKALAEFEEAARLAPRETLAHNGAGIARLCLGDPEGAARAFRRSLEIDPDQGEIRQALSQLP